MFEKEKRRAAKLNETAIRAGKILSEGVSLREDYSEKLGENLGDSEFRCYALIHQATFTGPISAEELSYTLLKSNNNEYKLASIYALVSRIREKLGKMSVIGKHGMGYQSLRALIEMQSSSNKS